jgi:hypothetical protein
MLTIGTFFWFLQDRSLPFKRIWALIPIEQKDADRPADQTGSGSVLTSPTTNEGIRVTATEQHRNGVSDRSPVTDKATQTTATEQHRGEMAERSPTVSKVAIRGSSLSKMAQQIYGTSDAEIIKLIREHNPQITDPDIIVEGSTIVFPYPASYEKAPDNKDLQGKSHTIPTIKEAQ